MRTAAWRRLFKSTTSQLGLLLDSKLLKRVLEPPIDLIDSQRLHIAEVHDLERFTALDPSAENIAGYFYDQTNSQLNGMTDGRVRVKDRTISETDTTTATFYEQAILMRNRFGRRECASWRFPRSPAR